MEAIRIAPGWPHRLGEDYDMVLLERRRYEGLCSGTPIAVSPVSSMMSKVAELRTKRKRQNSH
jgi:hypothetical protein